jgi:hypothetical protein
MQSIGVEAVDPAVGLGFELVVYQTRYGTGLRRRVNGARSTADITSLVVLDIDTRHPKVAPGIDIDDERGVAEPGVRPHR